MGTYTFTGTPASDDIQIEIPYENPGVLDVKADGKAGNDTIGLDYQYVRDEYGAFRGGVYSGAIELHGGSGNDVISHAELTNYTHAGVIAPNISSVSTTYYGNDGDDVLTAASRRDKYWIWGDGNDDLRGGPGNDTYYIFELGDKVTEASGAGYDTVVAGQSSSFENISVALPANCEKLVLADVINLGLVDFQPIAGSGNGLGNLIVGNALDNQLKGAGGSDTIYGATPGGLGGGDELPWGTLVDADTIHGGAGNDVIYGGQSNDDPEDGPDTIYGDAGDDTVWAGGGGDVVRGGAGNDSLYGQSDDDQLYGGDGADMLGGGSGNDRLDGGLGDDRLTGREGLDRLYGGGGDDRFDYDADAYSSPGAANRDVIYDFTGAGTAAGDLIDLSTIDADTGVSGNQTFDFIGNAAFSSPGQLRVQGAGTDSLVQANVTGTAGAEMEILAMEVAYGQWEARDFIL